MINIVAEQILAAAGRMKNRFTQFSLDADMEAANAFWKVIQENK